MLARELEHLGHLGGGDIVRIDPAGAGALMMDFKHDPNGGLTWSFPNERCRTSTTNYMGV